jgi:predicted methyltransferase
MPGHIRLERDDVIKEIEAAGFKLVSKVDSIGANQYMLTFAQP